MEETQRVGGVWAEGSGLPHHPGAHHPPQTAAVHRPAALQGLFF